MPIDAGIYGQFAEPARSTADYQAQYDSQAQRQMALQENRLALMQAQQLDKERSGLRSDLQSGRYNLLDPKHRVDVLSRYPNAAGPLVKAVEESQGKQATTMRDTEQAGHYKAQAGEINAKTARDDYASAAKFVMVNPTLDNARRAVNQMAAKYGGSALADLQQLEQIGDNPDGIRQWAAGHSDLAAKETLPQLGVQDNGGSLQPTARNVFTGAVTNVGAPTAKVQTPDNAANVGATLEGQKITDKRERDLAGNRLAQEKNLAGKPVYDTERAVMVSPGSATATPVMMGGAPLGAKEKDLTEGQSKALMFGSKMQQAANVLDEVGKTADMRGAIKGTAMAVGGMVPFIGDKVSRAAGTLTNVTQSQAQQRYETAKYQWIAGQLRKESGAVIGPQEYQDADEHYFPQPGDDAVTKADKAKQRKLAEQTMLAEVPEKKRPKAAGGNTDFVGVNSSQSDIFSAADAILSGRK